MTEETQEQRVARAWDAEAPLPAYRFGNCTMDLQAHILASAAALEREAELRGAREALTRYVEEQRKGGRGAVKIDTAAAYQSRAMSVEAFRDREYPLPEPPECETLTIFGVPVSSETARQLRAGLDAYLRTGRVPKPFEIPHLPADE